MENFYLSPPSNLILWEKLSNINREFIKCTTGFIGESVLKKPIYSISIGNLNKPVIFVGGVHGQEWLTVELLVYFVDQLCKNLFLGEDFGSKNLNLSNVLKHGVVFVPMLNPDGIAISLYGAKVAGENSDLVKKIIEENKSGWQANANGVDINHNFDAGFQELKKMEKAAGIILPSPRQYGGENAHSEPETQAIVRLINDVKPRAVYAFHSQGEEIFYKYGEKTPVESYFIAKLISALSGYKLVNNNGLCSHGGLKDYCIEKLGIKAFTIEIGKGKNPLPIENLFDIYDKLEESLIAMCLL